jgi:uncharacterized protein (AIM24 family)
MAAAKHILFSMAAPVLLQTTATAETFAGVTYHIDGELVPVLTVDITNEPVYFEHHILLWKNPTVGVAVRPVAGAFKRMMAGMQIFVTETTGRGQIAFSRDGAGHIFAIHMDHGDEIHVREHQFLAATANIDYDFERVKGVANILFGGNGFFIDRFHARKGPGILWLHGYGNVFEKTLDAHEQLDVEPGGWLYKDTHVRMETTGQRLSTGLLGGFTLFMNRFTGPGKVAMQSMYVHMPSES